MDKEVEVGVGGPLSENVNRSGSVCTALNPNLLWVLDAPNHKYGQLLFSV
uniref:Uncharacterized protein n=1 Tax=Nelumbo nucifera TaxID=4432 RepID=A0A822YQI7_NELNU|nr:TPA_asm: hypothetical protein HUJ06_012146 [Nelumbo nucifera]